MSANETKASAPCTRAQRRPAKVFYQGVEILPPAVPPDTPMWVLRRAVKSAVKQYKDELAKQK